MSSRLLVCVLRCTVVHGKVRGHLVRICSPLPMGLGHQIQDTRLDTNVSFPLRIGWESWQVC